MWRLAAPLARGEGMSVINDMLAQLDKRRAKPVTVGETVVAAPAAAAPQGTRWKLLMLVGVGAVAVSATALGNWPDLMGAKRGHVPRPVSMGADAPVAPASAVVAIAASHTSFGLSLSKPIGERQPLNILSESKDKLRANGASTPAPQDAKAIPEASPAAPPVSEARIDKKMATLSPAQRAESHYRDASEAASTGHSTQAIERALDALKADAGHVAARQLAAVLMVEKSRFDEAAVLLRDGLERTPQQPQLAYLLARIKVETGDRAGALALLQGSELLSAEGFALRAGLLSQQGHYANALPSYEAALRRNPDVAITWLGLAVALDAEGQTGQARQAYLRAKAVGAVRGELSTELQTYIEQKLAAIR
jgi:tetratricopeptide (TPR) repeat protein